MTSQPRRIVYPGTFDPITHGHIDVVTRALQIFDEVILAIAVDSTKKPLFTIEERQTLAEKALATHGAKIRVVVFRGLLVDFVQEQGARAILRGLRAVSDFEFEFQMALMNRKLADSIETLFLMPRGAYTYLSSTIIKEIGRLGGDVSAFVPPMVQEAMQRKFQGKKP
ncbi:MAG TPA: pantetheine-phosphate adenylyltransferase [Candidatus Methylacidiphilales bacterium]|nr:pantetheine-phosphate adenylyltransferase [Candidatus Methylacidiphilales bacterium]